MRPFLLHSWASSVESQAASTVVTRSSAESDTQRLWWRTMLFSKRHSWLPPVLWQGYIPGTENNYVTRDFLAANVLICGIFWGYKQFCAASINRLPTTIVSIYRGSIKWKGQLSAAFMETPFSISLRQCIRLAGTYLRYRLLDVP